MVILSSPDEDLSFHAPSYRLHFVTKAKEFISGLPFKPRPDSDFALGELTFNRLTELFVDNFIKYAFTLISEATKMLNVQCSPSRDRSQSVERALKTPELFAGYEVERRHLEQYLTVLRDLYTGKKESSCFDPLSASMGHITRTTSES